MVKRKKIWQIRFPIVVAVKKGDCRLAAEQGDAEAQNTMGVCFATGDGVVLDDAEAVKWFTRAATQDNNKAMNNLAVCYCRGRGVTQSYAEAATLFGKAMWGDWRAKYNLACLYYYGWGVPQLPDVALRLCSKAAEHGEGNAAYTLACHYYWGIGVGQDYKSAVRWLKKEPHMRDALLMLGECAAMGIDVREHRDAALRAYASAQAKGIILEKPKELYPLSLSFVSGCMLGL